MNTIESCVVECPIIKNLSEENKQILLDEHRRECTHRQMGQLGILCGMPQGLEKDMFSRHARQLSRSIAIEV